MNNGPLDISTIIIVGVAIIIGVILLVMGNRKNKRMLRIVGIGFCIGAGMTLFVESTELREILTAFAAVAAVIIAAFSIDQSRQIRQDSIERESRDRKERLINEVTEWLRELDNRVFPELGSIIKSKARDTLQGQMPPEARDQLYELEIILATADALSGGIKKAEYYQKLTSQLDEKLSSLIEVIVKYLNQRRPLIMEEIKYPLDYGKMDKATHQLIDELIKNDDKPLGNLALSNQAIAFIRVARNAHAIRKSILNAVDRAIEIKISLIM